MKTRVAMLFGGKSVEHEVSVISGIQAVMNMDTDKYEVIPVYMTKRNEMYIGEEIGKIESYKNIDELLKKSQRVIMTNEDGRVFLTPFPVKLFGGRKPVEIDVAFPVVHGTNVEDGAFQGYLKTMGIPFVGCDVTASAIGMDKYIMKAVLKECDVPVLDAQLYTLSDYAQIETLLDKVEKGMCHILERNGGTMEQFQIISIIHLYQRSDLLRIKLGIISVVDTIFQFFLGKVCQE